MPSPSTTSSSGRKKCSTRRSSSPSATTCRSSFPPPRGPDRRYSSYLVVLTSDGRTYPATGAQRTITRRPLFPGGALKRPVHVKRRNQCALFDHEVDPRDVEVAIAQAELQIERLPGPGERRHDRERAAKIDDRVILSVRHDLHGGVSVRV